MDVFLGRITSQAMNYAIRSGITITTTYAIKQCTRLLKEAPRSKEREELMRLQVRLESKIKIISPAIDMIELISARGNTSLESAVALTKELRYEIQRLGAKLNKAASEGERLRRKGGRGKEDDPAEGAGLASIVADINLLLVRIEDAVPLINLAITTSGVNLSTKLSGTISPSRLLQASTFLTAADTIYTNRPGQRAQVGPTWTLSVYMLFAGHAWRPVDEAGVRETTWKEVVHKARMKLVRVPLDQLYALPGEQSFGATASETIHADGQAAEFGYQLMLIEDLDDDRVHTFEDAEQQPGPLEDIPNAGIRDVVPIHEISKIFYADTGKILNIGGDSETNSPVLLLKRDVHAEPPRRMLRRSEMENPDYFDDSLVDDPAMNHGARDESQSEVDAQFERESAPPTPRKMGEKTESWRLPADLDPEWMAFEVYSEEPDSDSDDEEAGTSSLPSHSRQGSVDPSLAGALSRLALGSANNSPAPNGHSAAFQFSPSKYTTPPIKTSLSLLEMLLKLAALQQFRQASHLTIEDELLNFFLEDSATAGAGPDKEYRQRLRHDAVRRVGFDPYDESPVKRRGEVYIAHAGAGAPENNSAGLLPYDQGYGFDGPPNHALDFVHPSLEPPSSPSPVTRPLSFHHTPSRTSTPGSSTSSESHRNAVQAKYANNAQSGGGRNTPPSSSRNRIPVLRAQSDPRPRSPLAREVVSKLGDEGLGTSPASVDLGAGRNVKQSHPEV